MARATKLNSKYDHRVTVRLSEKQFNWLIGVAEMMDCSPSDYIRMSLNTAMSLNFKLDEENSLKGGKVGTNENVKANSDNIV